jgi:hypothetical protein
MCWATARAINNQHAEEGNSAAIDMTYALRLASDQLSGQPQPEQEVARIVVEL